MTRRQIFSWFFFGIFILLIYLFYKIIEPFILPLFWAGVLALLLYPLYEHLTKTLSNRAGISSAIMTVLTILVIVLPLSMIITTLVVEMLDVYQGAKDQIEVARIASIVGRLKGLIPITFLQKLEKRFGVGNIRPEEVVLNGIGVVSGYLFNQVQNVAKNVSMLIFNFIIMIFALFFFFRDGRRLYEELKYLIPMTNEQKDRIFSRFYDMIYAVILGIIATSALQGLIAGLIFQVLGIAFPVLAGVLTFIFSLIPMLGAIAVWLPVGIYLLFTGEVFKGIALLILGGVLISSVDNIIRTIVIGERTKLHTLFLFLSIVGGIGAFGFSGIILGPILLAIFVSFIEIYKAEYRKVNSHKAGSL
jgi:predicted PurR-regulated permease PerM